MTLPNYNQPQLSVPEQISLLKSDGLIFKDEQKAIHNLKNISFFRLKSYFKPLRITDSTKFKPDSTFEDGYSIYKFDSELRKLICSELEKFEISLRTQLSLIMGDEAGIYWFKNSDNFRDARRHLMMLANLQTELDRSDEEEIIKFRHSYKNFSVAYLPIFMMIAPEKTR